MYSILYAIYSYNIRRGEELRQNRSGVCRREIGQEMCYAMVHFESINIIKQYIILVVGSGRAIRENFKI